jgi:hypothetical protein
LRFLFEEVSRPELRSPTTWWQGAGCEPRRHDSTELAEVQEHQVLPRAARRILLNLDVWLLGVLCVLVVHNPRIALLLIARKCPVPCPVPPVARPKLFLERALRWDSCDPANLSHRLAKQSRPTGLTLAQSAGLRRAQSSRRGRGVRANDLRPCRTVAGDLFPPSEKGSSPPADLFGVPAGQSPLCHPRPVRSTRAAFDFHVSSPTRVPSRGPLSRD